MKINFNKTNLVNEIQNVVSVISTKSTLPILANMLIEAKNDIVKLTATDLDLGIVSSIKADVQEEGATTVPARKFYEIVKEMPEGELSLSVKLNNVASIESGRCLIKINGLPKEEFPSLPDFKEAALISMPQNILRIMLLNTYHSVSHDETRYVLNGILWEAKGGKLRLVATDGRRLALIETDEIKMQKDIERKEIVPLKTVLELNRILKEEGDVTIRFGANQILFDVDNVQLISRLIEGSFPDYEGVIPKEVEGSLAISKDAFLMATRRIGLLATVDSQSIRIDMGKNKMLISKTSPAIGEAKEELDVAYQGEEFSIGFNPAYLIDGLKNLTGAEVRLQLNGPEKPGVIRTEDGGYLYVVLPMQVG